MNYETISFTEKDQIATILLNRPERLNALNPTMIKELGIIVEDLKKDEQTRVVVITGAGRAFCAGGDVKVQSAEIESNDPLSRIKRSFRPMNEVISGIRNLRKPVIAAVNGVAVGAGLSLALACDMRIASTKARFGMVFVKTGLHPDTGATHLLSRLIGTARACELIFTGDIIGAEEADRIGLVNRVVESDRLESTVFELATKIAKRAPVPIQSAKGLIYKSLSMDLSVISEWEMLAQMVCVQTKDHAEGLAAFFDKREPVFLGK